MTSTVKSLITETYSFRDGPILIPRFTNTTVVTDKVFPHVTCHTAEGFEESPPSAFEKGTPDYTLITAIPVTNNTWDQLLLCSRNATNITVFDADWGCGAAFWATNQASNLSYGCLVESHLFGVKDCAGPHQGCFNAKTSTSVSIETLTASPSSIAASTPVHESLGRPQYIG